MIACVIILTLLCLLIATDPADSNKTPPASTAVPAKNPVVRIPPHSLLLIALLASLLSGCVSTKYKMARKSTPSPVPLNLAATQPPVVAVLNTVIIYQGPGSWKRTAFWDEYVVTFHNQGDQPLTITSAGLVDFAGARRAPGSDPWALEKDSKTLEQKYRDAGVAFVRNAAPGLLLGGAGASFAAVSFMSAGAAGAATVCLVALPVYYVTVWAINSNNKSAIVAEFNRRRLTLPLVLAPGATRTGSLFFPMVPNPRSLGLQWSSTAGGDEVRIPLDSLHGLHVKAPAPASAKS